MPCEKFRRATSRPARTSWRNDCSSFEAGPSVATIFARRRCSGTPSIELTKELIHSPRRHTGVSLDVPAYFTLQIGLLSYRGAGVSDVALMLLPRQFPLGIQLRVELHPDQDAQGGNVEPYQGRNRCSYRPINNHVDSKTRDIPSKD